MHISWARLASFCHLGVISDPLIVSKFHNEIHDPKGQENKIYTIVNLGDQSLLFDSLVVMSYVAPPPSQRVGGHIVSSPEPKAHG